MSVSYAIASTGHDDFDVEALVTAAQEAYPGVEVYRPEGRSAENVVAELYLPGEPRLEVALMPHGDGVVVDGAASLERIAEFEHPLGGPLGGGRHPLRRPSMVGWSTMGNSAGGSTWVDGPMSSTADAKEPGTGRPPSCAAPGVAESCDSEAHWGHTLARHVLPHERTGVP